MSHTNEFNFNSSQQKLWEQTADFVKSMVVGRDQSHDYNHMQAVARDSIKTYILKDNNIPHSHGDVEYLILVAWLHDVFDHKYPNIESAKKKTRDWIQTLNLEINTDLVFDIIERISYSKEMNDIHSGDIKNWESILGKNGTKIRDIVSDADKIEALGDIGFQRCYDYTKYKNPNLSHYALVERVCEHSNEKLFKLKDMMHFNSTKKEALVRDRILRSRIFAELELANPNH